MCGIVGLIAKKNQIVQNIHEFQMMLDLQYHRGPDDTGIATFRFSENSFQSTKNCKGLGTSKFDGIIGHNRLSILDLTDCGHQPMISPDGQAAIVFNGEIYNAFEEREKLIQAGERFYSNTDTEVILRLYMLYGIDRTLSLLNGMFAFCIVDLHANKVILARDRMGIKPLYFVDTNREFVFASEEKTFLARTSLPRTLNMESVYGNFCFVSCGEAPLLGGVSQVMPGEYLVLNAEGTIHKEKWFDINTYISPRRSDLQKGTLVSNFEKILDRRVNAQMISDVKVGCQLSGGIDSSLVSYYARETGYNDAISITLADPKYSEEPYMDHVAEKLGINIHKKQLDADYMLKNIEKAVWHIDSTVNVPNSLGIMLLAEESKKYVTVLLSGEGADELAGGYGLFEAAFLHQSLQRCPLVKFRPKMSEKVRQLDTDAGTYILHSNGYTDEEVCRRLFCGVSYKQVLDKRKTRISEYSGSIFNRLRKYQIEYYLPDLLMRQDKMTMASSVENRVPMLDNDVLDFLLAVPEQELVGWQFPKSGGTHLGAYVGSKKLLKGLCRQIYGKEFTYRRKSGFTVPLYEYFTAPRFRDYFYDQIVTGMKGRGFIDATVVRGWYENVAALQQNMMELLWRAVNLEIWCQLFLDRRNHVGS